VRPYDSPEYDDHNTHDSESAQCEWEYITLIPVSDSLPH
jgi:hypothetical protein